MAKTPNISHATINLLKEKASHSSCTYRVAAICFDHKGNLLGHTTNKHADWDVVEKEKAGRAGTSKHAERLLISRYSNNIGTIVIARIGHSGQLRKIDPCPACRKAAEKYGIKIVSIGEEL